MRVYFGVVCSVLLIPLGFMPIRSSPPEPQELTANGIRNLAQSLRFVRFEATDEKIKFEVTTQVHRLIDEYITRDFAATSDARDIEKGLQDLLQHQPADPEFSGPPFSMISDLQHGRMLLTAYMLARGGRACNDSAVTIRAYRVEDGRFRPAAFTGEDFDGYSLFVRELAAPVPGESWLLAWGRLACFNGNRTRIRVYAFDGTTFRTLWAPQDFFEMKPEFTPDGFAIIHRDEERYRDIRRPPFFLRDIYVLLPGGPHRIASFYVE